MDETARINFLNTFRDEFRISNAISDSVLEEKLKSSMFVIDEIVGYEINYEEDIEAKELLKYRIFYDLNFRLAEFDELYGGNYAALQIKYYRTADIS